MTRAGVTPERAAQAQEGFDRWRDFLGLAGFGYDVPAFRRLRDATAAVREFRNVNNYAGADYERELLAVRVVADTLATEVEQAAQLAPQPLDASTVAWVVAGLRCSLRPFCGGCSVCQTVTAPLRPAEPLPRALL